MLSESFWCLIGNTTTRFDIEEFVSWIVKLNTQVGETKNIGVAGEGSGCECVRAFEDIQ